MRKLVAVAITGLLATSACSREPALEVKPGSSVSLQKKDGVQVVGRLVEVKPEHLVVETSGGRTEIPRAEITAIRTDSASAAAAPQPPESAVGSVGRVAADSAPRVTPSGETTAAEPGRGPAERTEAPRAARHAEYREVTIPAGTVLPVELRTAVASDTSHVEDRVQGILRLPLTIDGVEVLPAGSSVTGHVTAAERAARVKGRARVAFRFTAIDPAGDAERTDVRTEPITRLAPATRKQDAAKIGGGAAGGAIIGGILGGGDGAAKGAAIGGAAGTGVVLSTRGKEIRVGPGTPLSVRLAAPVTIRVRTS